MPKVQDLTFTGAGKSAVKLLNFNKMKKLLTHQNSPGMVYLDRARYFGEI